MSAGEENGNGFHENREQIVDDAIEPSQEHAADIPPAIPAPTRPAGGSAWRSSCAGMAGRAEPVRFTHPEFRTGAAFGELTVTGVLPAATRPPVGSIAISGDVRRLSCDQALELADALLLVVTRMDVVAEQRYGASTDATRDRED